ncbi:MAG: transcriptional regulator PpsR [Beijerinckiaceae bacterium]|nr:transcriptional regulator PpsR [Beijerinckiaceae bacterium]
MNEALAGQPVAQVLAAAADVVVLVDGKGVVVDVSSNVATIPADAFVGRRLSEIVTLESKAKVADMLAPAPNGPLSRKFEINHRMPNGSEVALLYSAFRAERGTTVAAGRDLSSIAQLQQRLVEAQRLTDEHFLRLRTADARYRILFHLSGEAVMLADAVSLKILDVNPAAAELFDSTPGRLLGKRIGEVFSAEVQGEVETQIETVRVTGKVEAARAKLADGRNCWLSAVLFRDGESGQILVRVTASEATSDHAPTIKSKALRLMEEMPDAFVVLDPERRVLDANLAFLDLLDIASLAQARGQEIDRWLGRTAVEADILFNNLRDHKVVRGFVSNVRSEHGAVEEALITAVALEDEDRPLYGLVIRPEARRSRGQQPSAETSRSAEELAELVGRVPLKELVRETTEITERLCIEASLRLTGDNRAAAAQMLGLSRQGLYDKLRRYDMIDAAQET